MKSPIDDEKDDGTGPSGVVECKSFPGEQIDEEDMDAPPQVREFPNKMAQFLAAINKVIIYRSTCTC